jgi:TRAP-type C4-dicarboxylate transport system permease small subunit
MTRGHVGVDFIQMLVGDRTRRWMDRVGAWLGLAFCVVMTVATGLHLFEALEGGWTTSSVAAVPLWMPLSPVVFGFALLSLQSIVEIMKLSGEPS